MRREYGPDKVPYIPMRLVAGLFGVYVIPISYCTVRQFKCQPITAILVSLLVTFENALVTQSRLILLDAPLVFFTASSVFAWSGLCNEQATRPFTKRWWTWLFLTGASLGAVLSVKWVGLFTIATIGVSTIVQLWDLLADLRLSLKSLFRHFVARAIALIVVPALFYLATFRIHFWILTNSGDGDGFMSSEFQHTLRGHGMDDTFAGAYLYLAGPS
jgi:dolichyl-phosphate-mannose-protein mannosyltransferase